MNKVHVKTGDTVVCACPAKIRAEQGKVLDGQPVRGQGYR